MIGFSLLAGTVLCALGVALLTIRKRRNAFAAGMSFASLMAVIALLIHSAVDFNLQILANSSLFMIVLAIPFITRHLGSKEPRSPTCSAEATPDSRAK